MSLTAKEIKVAHGLFMSVNLHGEKNEVIGYKAKKHRDLIDLDKKKWNCVGHLLTIFVHCLVPNGPPLALPRSVLTPSICPRSDLNRPIPENDDFDVFQLFFSFFIRTLVYPPRSQNLTSGLS